MPGEVMMPREASKFIFEHSKDVSINMDGVNNVAKLVSWCFIALYITVTF